MVILVTAQDARMGYFIFQALRQDGHTVLHARSAESTVLMAAENREADLLITVNEPPDMNSWDLYRRILVERPRLKWLIVLDGILREDIRCVEGVPVLMTPFTPATLRSMVRDISNSPMHGRYVPPETAQRPPDEKGN